LLGEADVCDFVEEERAAVGHFKAARAVRTGIGERTFDVAEQFALEQALRKAARVDGYECARRAGRVFVEAARDDAFADARFAGDENTGIGGSDAGDHIQHGLHCARFGEQSGRCFAAQHAVFRFEALATAEGAGKFNLCAKSCQQAGVIPGLLYEVARAVAHRFDGEIDGAPGGHDDDGKRGGGLLEAGEEIESFGAGSGVASVVEIDQRSIEVLTLHGGKHRGRRRSGVYEVAFRLEKKAESFEDAGLVVGHQDAGSGGGRHYS